MFVAYGFSKPLFPATTSSGVCPPLKPAGTFPCCFWPLCPRPDVLPFPLDGPRPRRIFFLYAFLLSDKEERMEAERCWFRDGYKKGASGRYGVCEEHFVAVLSSCNRGGMIVLYGVGTSAAAFPRKIHPCLRKSVKASRFSERS